ncbi:MAG: hypothetical protein L3K06_00550 [Thermoplasmata archaeon]|nr:hypothetical protein [Thermoplasmata archaeon]
MGEPDTQLLCPSCQALITVEAGWRIAQCPRCGAMVTRMGEDSAYD